MAVTKNRKISSWTLLIVSIISLVVLGMFFGGGVVDPAAEMKEYTYTGLLIDWTSVLFIITIVLMACFGLMQFISLLKIDPKKALSSLVVVVLFAAILFISYSMGDATPLNGLNEDSQLYNTAGWLKITDMWIYSTVILLVLILAAALIGTIKKAINK